MLRGPGTAMGPYARAGSVWVGLRRRLATTNCAPSTLNPNAAPSQAGHPNDVSHPELEMVAGHNQATQGNADPTSDNAA